ncbi:hypothetical protein T01_3954 [Trichinella spiralis]|uniref:Uncharacterized protein n=1 Tax=Trichinella spiralis TaxID=6334 RepID=A0A0V1ASD6_TRISP|nr:hypothetical protein T01_3954 [Trichinella spiralis]
MQAAGEFLHTFQPQKTRVNGVCGGSVKVAFETGFSNFSGAKMRSNFSTSAHGNPKTVADASSHGSACEHVEAVFARIVSHCTHYNVPVNGLTCSICHKHFKTANAVASHFTHCRKQVYSVLASAGRLIFAIKDMPHRNLIGYKFPIQI